MSPDYSTILFDVRDRIATVTLNRPDSLNAFSGQMGQELEDAYRRCDRDDGVRAVTVATRSRTSNRIVE